VINFGTLNLFSGSTTFSLPDPWFNYRFLGKFYLKLTIPSSSSPATPSPILSISALSSYFPAPHVFFSINSDMISNGEVEEPMFSSSTYILETNLLLGGISLVLMEFPGLNDLTIWLFCV
jgi:hypothetical protein